MKKISVLPQDDKTCGWSGIIPERMPNPCLSGQIKADWIVLGAGLAGLAAARRLAENRPHEQIALIDAQCVGDGAAGRNSGFGIDLPHNVGSSLEELSKGQNYMNLARTAIQSLREQMNKYGFECDWSDSGKYHAAVTERGAKEVLEPTVQELERLNEPYEWLDRAETAKRLGTGHFAAAVYTYGTILVNPAAMVRGLADNMPDNVTIYENSPVIEADFGNIIQLKTKIGTLTAPKMILAVNAFSEKLGFWKNRILPFAAHASLTRQLTEAEQKSLGNIQAWGLTPANAFAGITMRYTNDHRILIRQNIHYCPSLRQSDQRRAEIAKEHQKLCAERFPTIGNIDMEYTWTGYLGMTGNGQPGFGAVADNIWSAVAQNGVGITKGTFSGMLAADLATSQDNPLIQDMIDLGTPNRLPPRPLLDIGVKSRFAWELWRNSHEA